MAVSNPPGFLQNAGATHTGEQFRNWHGLLVAGKTGATALIPRGGVHPALGNSLQVTQTGSPSMAIIVKSGEATIPGSEGSKQGVYSVLNDADVTVSITAAHATLNRIDSIVFKVQDTAYSGATNSSSIVSVDGTPASSPSPPTLPNNCIELARVTVGAAVTSVVTGNITDRRPYMAGTGGIISCTSTTRPAANTVNVGQVIYEIDTTNMLRTDDGGTTWTTLSFLYRARSQVVGAAVGTVTISGIPTNLRKLTLEWSARGDIAAQSGLMGFQIGGDTGTVYAWDNLQVNNTTVIGGTSATNTRAILGLHAGASMPSGPPSTFGHGTAIWPSWDVTTIDLSCSWMSGVQGSGAANQSASSGNSQYLGTNARTSITLIPASGGNFIAGTDFQLYGERS